MNLINFPKDNDNKGMDMRMFVKRKIQEVLQRGKQFADEHGGIDKVKSEPVKYTNDEKNISVIKADGNWLINLK
ncbi:hypothetical protein A9G34_01620 [Gilliamella sp. Choc4-2]|uniref:hypothetical protein n=1 Tax=unclassified Gilliamella TaxID=2685620 RepID=UPI00080EDC43|nr:hypothetical protein [Gilliamella apicola]OCG32833.1 hypothetical protein A9G33_02200 [Gilliamella apicola]OCG45822.1 hypothetical protein A9G34_01620 [Gilliamella apicola]